jgi:hypothetical protein
VFNVLTINNVMPSPGGKIGKNVGSNQVWVMAEDTIRIPLPHTVQVRNRSRIYQFFSGILRVRVSLETIIMISY